MSVKLSRHDRYRLSLGRRLSAGWRVLPDFIILGAQKAGTTTLFDNLVKHPNVKPSDIKEVHFFDNNWLRGEKWYRAHFPFDNGDHKRREWIAGEGSPYYLMHPLVAARIKQVVPNAKLLIILRDPVTRAYSHFQHEKRKGREKLSFEEALAAEEDRLAGEQQRLENDPEYCSFPLQHYSYKLRGHYAEQIERYFHLFDRKQVCVLDNLELDQNFTATFDRLFDFLQLPPFKVERPKRSNVGSYERMREDTKEMLTRYFQPHDDRLETLLGRKLSWR